MYYIFVSVSALLFSLQFMFNNGYQKQQGSSVNSTLCFSFYTSLIGIPILLLTNKLHFEVSLFSALVAIVYGFANIAMIYCSIKAFQYANLSVYSVFSMIGGMALPFVYGILCREELTHIKVMCCVLIILSVLISIDKGKQSAKAFKYYILVFVLNGLFGVISKLHQSATGLCVDSGSFMILTKITSALISVVWLFLMSNRSFAVKPVSLAYCVGYSAFNCIGNLLLLISLLHLPASVQYPMVTGGSIIFAVIIDLIRKEKVTAKEIVAAVIAFAASALMAF